ncbi:hypothetical protein GOV14_01855 [Candidatus Pacearchaeota archaeon]|nr:hypothetical protein [Candidatus Pacearchaeota archaeon]
MKGIFFFCLLLVFLGIINSVSAAHYIVGIIDDSRNGINADGHLITLWGSFGSANNLTDTIGASGNSGVSNFYMIDCELLNTSCNVGDNLSLQVFDTGDGYVTEKFNVTVTGAGFDFISNITLNSPPNFTSFIIDDSITSPVGEIDLIAGSVREVVCEAIIDELDGDLLQNASAEFFDNVDSSYGSGDDNNTHYTNNSCYLNTTYGNENETQVLCLFSVYYNANPGAWNCTMSLEDNLSASSLSYNTTTVNTLLSVGLVDFANFTNTMPDGISDELILNVTNYGNVVINLSLSGYGVSINDGLAMNCSTDSNISVGHVKYNVSSPTVGDLNLSQTEVFYSNLSATPNINKFRLNYRQQEGMNEASNETYWRIYVPADVTGNCNGSIVFGATQAVAS